MSKVTVSSTVAVAPVQVLIQTMRENQGQAAAIAKVEAAVKAYNAAQPKGTTLHTYEAFVAVEPNTKGMQWQLAMLATLARVHGATMIRLSIHNGNVAICGSKEAVAAVQATAQSVKSAYGTMVSSAYKPDIDGNRMGFVNAYLCGCPAGMQIAAKVTPTLAYGLGYLFPFPVPGTGAAYLRGQQDAAKAYVPFVAKTPKTPKTPKPVGTEVETVTADADAASVA